MPAKMLTYGTLPTWEEFEAAFEALVALENAEAPVAPEFTFERDPRVGTCALTCSELWGELCKADWERRGVVAAEHGASQEREDAGQWCSDVLGVLGFEWV